MSSYNKHAYQMTYTYTLTDWHTQIIVVYRLQRGKLRMYPAA